MAEYLAPGAYLEEAGFRPKRIAGVTTTIAAFIGPTRYGPAGLPPQAITSLVDFERVYGDGKQLAFSGETAPCDNYVWHATRAFFENGGRQLYVVRVVDTSATRARYRRREPASTGTSSRNVNVAYARFPGAAGNGTLAFVAYPGANLMTAPGTLPSTVADGDIVQINGECDALRNVVWRRVAPGVPTRFLALRSETPVIVLSVSVTQMAKAASVSVLFTRSGANSPSHVWEGLAATSNALCAHFAAIPASDTQARTLPIVIDTLCDTTLHGGSLVLSGGRDGRQPNADRYEGAVSETAVKTGLRALEDIDEIAIVAAPGLAGLDAKGAQAGVLALQRHVEYMRCRVAIVDSRKGQSFNEARECRAAFDSSHMAFYYPWVKILDPTTGNETLLPPSGFVAGIYVRNDIERGVWKAPANATVNGAIGFELMLTQGEQEILNPEGINCLRNFPGRGMRLWGARTMSSDPEWKYVNLRRYFAYLERSIDQGTHWAVFEPNDKRLWTNIRRTIEDFLLNEWQRGALLGDKPEMAYFVRCDRSTMTQNDLDSGRLVCLIGVAPLKPAEFVTFRIGQWTADARA